TARPSPVRAPAADTIAGLILARGLRDFGDGCISVVLPVYLTSLGFSALEFGVLATAALLGSALLTLSVAYLAARHALRRLLLAAAVLMVVTGLAFASRQLRAAVPHRLCRDDQPIGGWHQRVRTLGAHRAQPRSRRPGAHPNVCPLRLHRRARGGGGIALCCDPRCARRVWDRSDGG